MALLEFGTSIAEVSSNFGGAANGEAWGAEMAIDGNIASEWATNGDGDDAFIALQFAEVKILTGFAFRSRKMPDGSSIIRSVRLIFDDGAELGPFETPDPDQRDVFGFETPISTQSVRLEAVETSGGNTGAKEIEFFSPE